MQKEIILCIFLTLIFLNIQNVNSRYRRRSKTWQRRHRAMGQQPNVQGQKPYMGPGQPFQSNPNLAVIDHPVKPTTTPKPPSSTVDGEGLVCMTTADCEVGCCFNTTGQLLDTTTYGAGGPQEGRGNKYTHTLTSSGKYELSVDMVDTSGKHFYANYGTFHIGDMWSKYKLTVSSYSGNAGNALLNHNGMKFTTVTVDQDNDTYHKNCAIERGGSWWYYACTACDLTRSGIHKPRWGSVGTVVKSVMMIRQT
ncbi:Hypothetical predicted protein [Mytilus galloprovincialis]|uniref:Fibrinogen C-terminal domain-containing protein n=1 Tax=Mytilus galloprovincialis TaxID=29158 RepID=A0A8B6EWI0_MYTGA|nr:Hypothetical predicted protein [Mytilus galloprovincialis]